MGLHDNTDEGCRQQRNREPAGSPAQVGGNGFVRDRDQLPRRRPFKARLRSFGSLHCSRPQTAIHHGSSFDSAVRSSQPLLLAAFGVAARFAYRNARCCQPRTASKCQETPLIPIRRPRCRGRCRLRVKPSQHGKLSPSDLFDTRRSSFQSDGVHISPHPRDPARFMVARKTAIGCQVDMQSS